MILKKKLKRKLKLKKSSDIEVLCSDGIKFMYSLPENLVDLIVTDPPYKTTPRGCAGNSGGMMQTEICKKGQMFKYNDLTPKDYADKMYRVLKEGDIVLDPFAGIMSTAIACKRTNRKFKGCEIDPKYFSIGKKLLKGEEIQDVDLI